MRLWKTLSRSLGKKLPECFQKAAFRSGKACILRENEKISHSPGGALQLFLNQMIFIQNALRQRGCKGIGAGNMGEKLIKTALFSHPDGG